MPYYYAATLHGFSVMIMYKNEAILRSLARPHAGSLSQLFKSNFIVCNIKKSGI